MNDFLLIRYSFFLDGQRCARCGNGSGKKGDDEDATKRGEIVPKLGGVGYILRGLFGCFYNGILVVKTFVIS